jgi:heme oxygenase
MKASRPQVLVDDRAQTHKWGRSADMVARAPTKAADVQSAPGSPPRMLVRLGLETRTHHASADEDRLALLDVANIDRYRAFLVRVHGFESVVEEALVRMHGLDRELLASRLKTKALRADLAALGASADEIVRLPRCSNVHLRSAPQAMGWLFVIERHTLLAGVIVRQLVRRLGDQLHGATAYLNAYGQEPGRRFRALGDALNACARRHSASAIVAAANECFRVQRQWYAVDSLGTATVRTSNRSSLDLLPQGAAATAPEPDAARSRRAG